MAVAGSVFYIRKLPTRPPITSIRRSGMNRSPTRPFIRSHKNVAGGQFSLQVLCSSLSSASFFVTLVAVIVTFDVLKPVAMVDAHRLDDGLRKLAAVCERVDLVDQPPRWRACEPCTPPPARPATRRPALARPSPHATAGKVSPMPTRVTNRTLKVEVGSDHGLEMDFRPPR